MTRQVAQGSGEQEKEQLDARASRSLKAVGCVLCRPACWRELLTGSEIWTALMDKESKVHHIELLFVFA